MTTHKRYCHLCTEFVSTAESRIDDTVLNAIKDYYKPFINSNRRFSQIKNLSTLIKILEKRDTLNFRNIEPLVDISSNFLNDARISTLIKDYKSYLENTRNSKSCDMNQDENVKEEQKTEPSQDTASSSQKHLINFKTRLEQEEELKKMVLSQTSERIGRSWRDTVRYLGIPEYQIDVIGNKYPFDMKEQSYQALSLCISEYCSDDWKLSLIRALERARRRDLKEMVEKLIVSDKYRTN
ncbi:fas-associated death domain protein isoform X1 [Halictus rubicundus]|uniref:fas-associated death domain protein isoform X1 n=1 Tax=Halictus rubicundus TaxID=77578 RepID=UPI004035B482